MKKAKQTENKVPFLKSMKGRVTILFFISILVTVTLILVASIPSAKTSLKNTTRNYMLDMATTNGELVDTAIEAYGESYVLREDYLNDMMKDVGVKGVKSSYAYLVSDDGTMLWHPTADKIGKPVENAVVSGLVKQLEDGKKPKSSVTSYDFKGVQKYASYYVSYKAKEPFIYVISADETEVLAPIQSMTVRAIICGVVIGALMFIFASIIMTKSLAPMEDINSLIRRMSNLDMTNDKKIDALAKRTDEFGQMARGAQTLQQRLSTTVNEIKNQSEKLFTSSDTMLKNAASMAETSGQVDQAVSDIAQGATSQADSTQKTTDNIVRIGEMIENTSHSVDDLNKVSATMLEAQNTASGILNDLDDINRQTTEAVEQIALQTKKTNESTVEIQKVTALISSIAEETNLLSLNASIEAARAGEAGKGFAVVAEEIGKLAEQSNQSTKQIEDIIAKLVQDSAESMKTMENVREITGRQSEDIGRTGEAFSKIAEGIAATNESVNNISNQMSEMDKARSEVVDSVESLSAIAEENAASTQESSASVTQINQIAGDIRDDSGSLRNIAEVLKNHMNEFKN